MTKISQDLAYEEAFSQLEAVLQQLESGELALEESLAEYERGAALAAYCEKKLQEAELRVHQWQPEGDPTPFDQWEPE